MVGGGRQHIAHVFIVQQKKEEWENKVTYFKLVHRWKRQRSDWIVLLGAKVDRFRVAVLSLGHH